MTEDVSYLQACVGALTWVLFFSFGRDLLDIALHALCCRNSQYNCDLCRYWACPAHYCRHKRAAIEKRNTNESAGVADQDSSCR